MSKFLIASLPRSGNHMLRFLVEYVTGRETLGIRHNPKDIPLHSSHYPDAVHILGHVAAPAIGRKVHYAKEISVELSIEAYGRTIVIYRQVTESALSHMLKSREFVAWQASSGRRKRKAYRKLSLACLTYMKECARFYLAIFRLAMPVTFLSYEKLISNDPMEYLPEISKLHAALGAAVDENRMKTLIENFVEIRRISAGRRGGDWGGINSGIQFDYYRSRSPLPITVPLALLSIPVKVMQFAAIRLNKIPGDGMEGTPR